MQDNAGLMQTALTFEIRDWDSRLVVRTRIVAFIFAADSQISRIEWYIFVQYEKDLDHKRN
jgi:hypothetical protein